MHSPENPFGEPFGLGDVTDTVTSWFDSSSASSPSNAIDTYAKVGPQLAKDAGDYQRAQIVAGGQDAAAILKKTAAQVQSQVKTSVTRAAVLAGGVYALAKWKGWI